MCMFVLDIDQNRGPFTHSFRPSDWRCRSPIYVVFKAVHPLPYFISLSTCKCSQPAS